MGGRAFTFERVLLTLVSFVGRTSTKRNESLPVEATGGWGLSLQTGATNCASRNNSYLFAFFFSLVVQDVLYHVTPNGTTSEPNWSKWSPGLHEEVERSVGQVQSGVHLLNVKFAGGKQSTSNFFCRSSTPVLLDVSYDVRVSIVLRGCVNRRTCCK